MRRPDAAANNRLPHAYNDFMIFDLFKYKGALSVGRRTFILEFMEMLKNAGLSLAYFMHEKSLDAVFPWDFIDTGISKEFLKKRWSKAIIAEADPICFDDCSKCGACTKESRKFFKKYWNGTIERDASTGRICYVRLKDSEQRLSS